MKSSRVTRPVLDRLFVRYIRGADHPCKLRIADWLTKVIFQRVIADTESGLMILDSADLIQRALLFYGLFEPATSALHKQLLRRGMVYVDIGANVGTFTLLASKLVGKTGKVIAVEPNPVVFYRLLQNLALNPDCQNVQVFLCACSASDGFAFLELPPASNSGLARISEHAQSGSFTIPTKPLVDMVAAAGKQTVDVLKIDVEGHEMHVLTSLFSAGMRPGNIIFEYSPRDFPLHSGLPELFTSHGYRLSTVTARPFSAEPAVEENNIWAQLESRC